MPIARREGTEVRPVIGTVQGGKVFIPEQVLPVLRPGPVQGVAPDIVEVDLVGGEPLDLRRARAPQERASRAGRVCFSPDGRATPGSGFRSGKRTKRRWVRSTTFQVTVSPASRSRAEARGRGMLA